MDKPNLVYITADQLKASAAPILGNPLISCPFMESLAAEGITFPETYAASTICTPSRASVFTGVHPLVHQVTCWQNKAPLNLPQLSDLFASAGYYTAVSGHFEQDGMIRYVDDQMNRVFRALGERDLLENTWVIFASDHGDFMGEKGLFEKCEVPYECLTHVPLVIRPPTKLTARRGIRIPGLVDLVDLFPTFLSMGGIPVPEYAQGHDLMDWVGRGARRPLRCVAFAQVGDYHGHLKSTFPTGTFNSGRRNALVRAGRSREFSYIRDPQYGDEAYDLTRDPRELDNLLHRGPVSDGVSQLRDEVDRWEEACLDLRKQLNIIPGDRGFEPGWE